MRILRRIILPLSGLVHSDWEFERPGTLRVLK
jgi:hypothetical protein